MSSFIPPDATYWEVSFFCMIGFLCFMALFLAVATFHDELERHRALREWEKKCDAAKRNQENSSANHTTASARHELR